MIGAGERAFCLAVLVVECYDLWDLAVLLLYGPEGVAARTLAPGVISSTSSDDLVLVEKGRGEGQKRKCVGGGGRVLHIGTLANSLVLFEWGKKNKRGGYERKKVRLVYGPN